MQTCAAFDRGADVPLRRHAPAGRDGARREPDHVRGAADGLGLGAPLGPLPCRPPAEPDGLLVLQQPAGPVFRN